MSFQENMLHPCFHYANSAPNGVFLIKHRTQESQNSPMATLQNVFPAVACYIRPMAATKYVFSAVELISDMLLYPLHSYLSENVKAF